MPRKSLLTALLVFAAIVFLAGPLFAQSIEHNKCFPTKVFRPLLEKLGFPANLDEIPNGMIRVSWSDANSTAADISWYQAVGCRIRLSSFESYFELLVPPGATFNKTLRVERIFFESNSEMEGWYLEYESQDYSTTQVPIQLAFIPETTHK